MYINTPRVYYANLAASTCNIPILLHVAILLAGGPGIINCNMVLVEFLRATIPTISESRLGSYYF